MAHTVELQALLDRIGAGTATERDWAAFRAAVAAGHVRFAGATGEGALAVAGNVHDAIVITGHNAQITYHGASISAIQQALTQMLRELSAEHQQVAARRQHQQAAERQRQTLTEYLLALETYCRQLAYHSLRTVSARARRRLPPVYIEPHLEERRPDAPGVMADRPGRDQRGEQRSETLPQALSHHRHLVLTGGPGAGKSSLLHHLALTQISAFAQGGERPLVPVPVFARTLTKRTKSLSENLYDEVSANLQGFQRTPLPVDLFTVAPAPGATWLVLLDGLDEIVLLADRRHLIDVITAHATRARSPYRFVVTSRPLADLTDFDHAPFGHYHVRPFGPAQVRAFAQRWFAAAPGPSRVLKKSLDGDFGASARRILNLRAALKLADSGPWRTFSAPC